MPFDGDPAQWDSPKRMPRRMPPRHSTGPQRFRWGCIAAALPWGIIFLVVGIIESWNGVMGKTCLIGSLLSFGIVALILRQEVVDSRRRHVRRYPAY